MKFTLETAGDVKRVTAWMPGGLRVGDRTFRGSVLVSAEAVLEVDLDGAGGIDMAMLDRALEGSPEVILVGTGDRQRFLSPALMKAVTARGVGIEVMDTIAAARTYNVLVGEGRRVVALLVACEA